MVNWMLLGPAEMPAHVFDKPDGAAARAMFAVPDDPEEGALARTRLTWAMGATGNDVARYFDIHPAVYRVGFVVLTLGTAELLAGARETGRVRFLACSASAVRSEGGIGAVRDRVDDIVGWPTVVGLIRAASKAFVW